MNNAIYEKMILDSSMPYIRVECEIENGEGIYYFREVNDSFAQLYFSKREEMINKPILDYIPQKDMRSFSSHRKEESDDKYLSYEGAIINDSEYSIEVYRTNSTELEVIFRRATSTYNYLNSSLKKSPFITFIKDLEGRYVDVNDAFLKMFKFEYKDIISKDDAFLWGPKGVKRVKEQDKEVYESNEVHIFHECLSIPNTDNRVIQVAKWPLKDENGKVVGILGLAMEITEHSKLQQIIESCEENFMDMSNNIDEVIVIRDEHKAMYVSPYFKELYGFEPTPLYEDINYWETYWDKLIYDTPKEDFYNTKITTTKIRIYKEGKTDKWIQSKHVPIMDADGNVIRKIYIAKDITKQVNSDKEIEEIRMEFFTNISHELRTPINIIMSGLQVINLALGEEGHKTIGKYLGMIKQNSLRLLRLVNNLIDTTKISSGTFAYNPKNYDLVAFTESIVDSVVEFAQKNNITIIFDTDIEEKVIAFDLNHYERIILNLISNGIKFNKPKGSVKVSISTKNGIEVKVKDTGAGIPSEKMDSIFQRYEQVDKNNRREREGSGIGLSIVKSLVEMNGGSIKLKSTLYQGSEFIITLPDSLVEQVYFQEILKKEDIDSRVNRMSVELSDIY